MRRPRLCLTPLESRLTPDATFFDPSFGAGGEVTLDGIGYYNLVGQVVLGDGSTVFAGTVVPDPAVPAYTDFAVIRLRPDGTPDPAFGTNGRTVIAFDLAGPGTGRDVPDRLAVAADGAVVVAGTANTAYTANDPSRLLVAVARLTPDGRLDPTFDGDGRLTFAWDDPDEGYNEVAALALRPDGSVLVAGASYPNYAYTPEPRLFAARLTPAGVPDPVYGTAGRVVEPDGEAAAYDRDGRLLVVRREQVVGPGNQFDAVAVRYDQDGQPDTAYGAGGPALIGRFAGPTLYSFSVSTPIVPLADGGALVGYVTQDGNYQTAYQTRRLRADGTLDSAFGPSGVVTDIQPDTVVEDSAGRLVGLRAGATYASLVPVIRLTPAGQPDPTFGLDGAIDEPRFYRADSNTPQAPQLLAFGPDETTVTVSAVKQSRVFLTRLRTTPDFLPTITTVADQTAGAPGRTVGPLAFTVGDVETPADQLVVTASTSDEAVVPAAGIVLAGSGAVRTITVTPAGTFAVAGRTAVVTLSVRAGDGPPVTTTFRLRVLGPGVAAGLTDGTVRSFYPDGSPASTLSAFGQPLPSGPRVASLDFNFDGVDDLAVGTGPGARNRVRILDGRSGAELFAIDPFEESYTGGVYVAAAVADPAADVTWLAITPDEGGGPRVRVFEFYSQPALRQERTADFFGIDDLTFRGGARPAFGDLNGDGTPDLVVAAGFGGGPRVAAFDGRSVLAATPKLKLFGDFFAFEETLRNGVFVAAGDLDGDGRADLVFGGGPGGGPRVRVLSGADIVGGGRQTTLANFFAGDPESRTGVRVAAKDLDGDGRADVVTGSGPGGGRVAAYSARSSGPAVLFDLDLGERDGVFVG